MTTVKILRSALVVALTIFNTLPKTGSASPAMVGPHLTTSVETSDPSISCQHTYLVFDYKVSINTQAGRMRYELRRTDFPAYLYVAEGPYTFQEFHGGDSFKSYQIEASDPTYSPTKHQIYRLTVKESGNTISTTGPFSAGSTDLRCD